MTSFTTPLPSLSIGLTISFGWNSYDCPGCSNLVSPEDRGKCSDELHPAGETRGLKVCPQCYALSPDEDEAGAAWTGAACDPGKGGCGWRVHERVVAKGRAKKGITNPKPMFKRIKRGMFQVGLFDESQMVKNANTKRGRAVQHIPGLKRTYVITGTMMTNYVQDTFWQLNMLFKGQFPINGQLKDYEQLILKKRLEEYNGNRTLTAKSLGVSVRWVQLKLKEMEK